MRHVIVMTVTGAIGLIAVFVVDALSLFWVSRLGDQTLKASIGYASQALFLLFSVNIGLTIAVSATVSRALGAGDRSRARRLAASALTITFVVTLILSALLFVSRDAISLTSCTPAGAREKSPAACSPSPSPPTLRWASVSRFPAYCARRATRGAPCG